MLDVLRLRLAFAVSLLFFAAGCFPTRGTQPTQTFRLEDRGATCTRDSLGDLRGPLWSAADRARLASKLQHDEPAVASVLGCHVEVLADCRAPGRSSAKGEVLARDLEGPCVGATDVVREVKDDHVELRPLSLGDYQLTGTFRGMMLQPKGPYATYDATLYLAQDGARVSGVTRLATVDKEYWGDLLFEGRLEGNVLFFADVDVLDDNLGFWLAWCTKGGYLLVDPRDGHLTGPWRAPMCAPGTLDVRRVPDHPRVLLPPRADAQ